MQSLNRPRGPALSDSAHFRQCCLVVFERGRTYPKQRSFTCPLGYCLMASSLAFFWGSLGAVWYCAYGHQAPRQCQIQSTRRFRAVFPSCCSGSIQPCKTVPCPTGRIQRPPNSNSKHNRKRETRPTRPTCQAVPGQSGYLQTFPIPYWSTPLSLLLPIPLLLLSLSMSSFVAGAILVAAIAIIAAGFCCRN